MLIEPGVYRLVLTDDGRDWLLEHAYVQALTGPGEWVALSAHVRRAAAWSTVGGGLLPWTVFVTSAELLMIGGACGSALLTGEDRVVRHVEAAVFSARLAGPVDADPTGRRVLDSDGCPGRAARHVPVTGAAA
jgi:hypothetical protein